MTLSRPLGKAMGSRALKGFLQRLIDLGPAGASEEARARDKAFLWGEARNEDGERVVSRMVTPESYNLTVDVALAAVEKVLTGDAPPGFNTPSLAYGADFIMEMEGVTREDLKES